MATIDLGKIKLVYRGAYNNSTAYTIDDVVQHTDSGLTSSFICTTNSTGNAPSTSGTVHGSWSYLAKGSSDATLTTQGDVLYYGASGNARLAAGTSGQVLTTGGSGANPTWGTISSDFVKLASQSLDATGLASFEFQNCFSAANDALYGGYHLQMYHQGTSNHGLDVRWMSGTNTELTGASDYKYAGPEGYRQTNNSSNTAGPANDGDGTSKMPWDGWGLNGADNATEGQYYSVHIQGNMYGGTAQNRSCTINASLRDPSSPNYIIGKVQGHRYEGSENITGMKFYLSSGNIHNGQCTLWGLKK